MQKATSRKYCFDKVGDSTLFSLCLHFCLEVASLNGTGIGSVSIRIQIFALVMFKVSPKGFKSACTNDASNVRALATQAHAKQRTSNFNFNFNNISQITAQK